MELKADESASTCVGQNSTQKPQALQRSTTIETRPFATRTPSEKSNDYSEVRCDYAAEWGQVGVTAITDRSEEKHEVAPPANCCKLLFMNELDVVEELRVLSITPLAKVSGEPNHE
ncbi:hypothetical protein SBA1_100040 [Candidatus Sulfotelmatobacter kueseliae]|uniref:Uncharacterized protein n=1 Tax=Candidatus Sulfotelmatobacter kueseliae TaxID=2042962 RepID=A0A2U3JVZ7_9BACT|nr:hypothetical protein SBA1_100040 [Candidatus Sulfotelmatobacter kueseliae]